jgi:hypothetical protein
MRSLLATIAAPALLVPFLIAEPAQAAATWSVPPGVNVELSTGVVGAMTPGGNGEVFVTGNFVSSDRANPTAFTIGEWRNGRLSPVGNSPSGAVSALAWDAKNGLLYAGGSIIIGSTIYGVAKWDGTAWTGVADMEFGLVNALAVDSIGTLYVGGTFTKVNGQTGFSNFARYSTLGWSALGTAFDDAVTSIAVDRPGNVYVAGYFSRWQLNRSTFGSVAIWDGDAWSVSGATNGRVLTVAVGAGNVLYGHGTFTEASGVNTRLAMMEPSQTEWDAVTPPPAQVTSAGASQMSFARDGALLIGIDGRVYTLKASRWTTIPGVFGGPIRAVVSDAKGDLLVGGAFTSIDRVRTPGLAVRSNAKRPGAPRTVSADDLGRRILVQWSAVSSTPEVTRYEAECRKGSQRDAQKLIVQSRAATFDVSSRGTYRCRVRAENAVGWSPWSRTVTVSVR